MTPGEALLLARRVARRMTRDTPLAWAEDYESTAALAILALESDDPALQWRVAQRAIIDEYRRIYGKRGGPRRRSRVEWSDTLEAVEPAPAPLTEQLSAARSLVEQYPLRLTENEREAVVLVAEGYSIEEIATELGTTHARVRSRLKTATEHLEARNRPHLVALALTLGEINPPSV